ncbi:hydroxymethylbilane synthase [Candidatus Zixiibacteriota bacterium]
MRQNIIIGSRGSDLALYQANFIKDILTDELNCQVEIKIIVTSGDKIDNLSFDKMEGKGFFTKEIEDELLAGNIDVAVHSLKDLMTTQPEGLKLGAVGYRVDRREYLLINPEAYQEGSVISIKDTKIIGTSSPRRKCQIANHNPSLEIKDLRGNVPTRIRKLREGQYDAIVIAVAGVERLELDLSGLKAVKLDAEQFLPAPAQGILGLQIRDNDERVENIIQLMNDKKAANEASLERGLLGKFDLGCSLPLGVYSEVTDDKFILKAILGVYDNNQWIGLKKTEVTGTDPKTMVEKAFTELNESEPCHDSE